MFDVLSKGFKKAADKLRNKAVLDEENISNALQDVRESLLEADVEYNVVKEFLNRVKIKALGTDVSLSAGKKDGRVKVTPGDHFVQICKEELENLMGPVDASLNLPGNRPSSIMMVGLQGTGKTTTTGKLAKFLMTRQKKKPLLVAADIYRPAAVEQLKVIGRKINVPVFSLENASPVEICKKAYDYAIANHLDLILFDTAGRLTIDSALMRELQEIKQTCKPDNILLVCDAMMGQDAVTTAKAFNEELELTGFILSKLDGDARGGAALSIKEVTGKPIKFLGMGEDLDRIEEFRPEGLASRILGMGDILGLMDDFERVSDGDKEEETLRMLQGQFTFKDFYDQISMIQKMGSLKDIIAKLPMQHLLPSAAQNINDKELVKIKAMIDSMTLKERKIPDIINPSRVRRISSGSGRSAHEVTELIKKFKAMRSMMGQFGKKMGGMMGKIPGMGSLSQLNQLRKMSANPQGLEGLQDMFGEGLGGADKALPKRIDKDKLKKARKAARQNRKKNRKK